MIKPIIFNTDMVRAILDGRKTVTRRICKDGNAYTVPDMSFYDANRRTYAIHSFADMEHTDQVSTAERTCPICSGDILWVRETWNECGKGYKYKADWEKDDIVDIAKWKPSIHMPKVAARIWLKVMDVRVELLWSITEEQAKEEGANWKDGKNVGWEEKMRRSAVERFAEIWNFTIKKPDLPRYGWEANPWVWVIGFERCGKLEET